MTSEDPLGNVTHMSSFIILDAELRKWHRMCTLQLTSFNSPSATVPRLIYPWPFYYWNHIKTAIVQLPSTASTWNMETHASLLLLPLLPSLFSLKIQAVLSFSFPWGFSKHKASSTLTDTSNFRWWLVQLPQELSYGILLGLKTHSPAVLTISI